jgi:hypothetical protein
MELKPLGNLRRLDGVRSDQAPGFHARLVENLSLSSETPGMNLELVTREAVAVRPFSVDVLARAVACPSPSLPAPWKGRGRRALAPRSRPTRPNAATEAPAHGQTRSAPWSDFAASVDTQNRPLMDA